MKKIEVKYNEQDEWLCMTSREESFDENIEVHLHEGYEIFYFKGGDIGYFVEGTHYTAKPGDLFITNARELHAPLIKSGVYDRTWIQMSQTFIDKKVDAQLALKKVFEERKSGQLNKIEKHLAEKYGLHTLLALIEEASQKEDKYQLLEIEGLIIQVIIRINRLFEQEIVLLGKEVKQNEKVNHILTYINQNLCSKITLKAIQTACFVDRYYLCHLFKKHTGISIYDYITNKRIMEAKKRILNDVPIVQVCYEVGFNDYSAFYKAFVKIENKSPKNYWRENKSIEERNKKMKSKFTLSGFADEIDPVLDVQIESFKKLGIEYIEMRGVNGKNIVQVSCEEAKAIKKVLDENGMKVSAIGSPIGKISILDDFDEELVRFKHILELSQILKVKYIRMFSFYTPKGEEKEQYFETILARWKQYLEVAEDYDVVLLHENEKGIYGDNAKRCKQLIEALHHPKVGVTFDPANFVQVQQDVGEAYAELAPYITYMHIKDANSTGENVPAGEGMGQLREVLQVLEERGYTGFLSLEPHLASFWGKSQLEEGCEEEATRREHRYYMFKKACDALKYLLQEGDGK